MKIFPYRLCLITDPAYLPEDRFEETIRAVLEGGGDMIQYRNLSASLEQRLAEARTLRRLTQEKGAALIINTDLELARAVRADGVQLGKRSLSIPEARKQLGKYFFIGASVHTAGEIGEAQALGADFLLLSPLFPPGSKTGDREALGPGKFARLCASAVLPVFALGGITPENAPLALQSGAHGLAVVSGILGARSVSKAARKLRDSLDARKDSSAS